MPLKEPPFVSDTFLARILELFYNPQDYNIHISWTREAEAKVCNNKVEYFNGYPCK